MKTYNDGLNKAIEILKSGLIKDMTEASIFINPVLNTRIKLIEKEICLVEPEVILNFADFKMAVSLLRDLADLQNGAPLVTYEKEWQRTMDNIYMFLNEHESKISN